jgi:signal peptide peptidase SppA
MSGATSAEAFGASVQAAAADPAVGAILIDVDSPGGAVSLIPETAQIVADAALAKPVVAIANTLMASAAYWLASQASEVVITPSGMAGSIGVLAMHADNSARLEQMGVDVSLIHAGQFKAEGNPFQPLTDEARADIQAKVDEFYGMFVDGVAQGRGVAASMVRDGFGQGRVVTAAEAVKAGMADRVATFDQTVEELLVRASADAGTGAHQNGAPPGAGTITETDPEAATSGLSFVREAIVVRDTATSLARRASSLAEVKRGRLTAAKRDALEDARDGLAAATTAITGLLAETDPARDAGRAALLDAEFAEMERTLIETGARP